MRCYVIYDVNMDIMIFVVFVFEYFVLKFVVLLGEYVVSFVVFCKGLVGEGFFKVQIWVVFVVVVDLYLFGDDLKMFLGVLICGCCKNSLCNLIVVEDLMKIGNDLVCIDGK